MGTSPRGIKGFGSTTVYGWSRVPRPPVRTTARSDIVNILVEPQILADAEPFNSAFKTLSQRNFGAKASGTFKFVAIATQAQDFALARTQSDRVANGNRPASHDFIYRFEEARDWGFLVRSNIKHLADTAVHHAQTQQATTSVFDKC